MPLIVMCGLPSSGKSARCKELADYLEMKQNRKVTVVGDGQQGIDKSTVYSESKFEKELRGNLKSDAQRLLNKDDVVIMDSLNYIKGFRYEMFCVCKSARTTLCVVQCDVTEDQARAFNAERSEPVQYSTEILDALFMRFEPPNSQNRWDSPLFIVRPEEGLPCDDIYNALYLKKGLPPNLSTTNQPLSATNYVQELDKITQQVVAHVMSEQKIAFVGESIAVPGAAEKLILSKTLTLGELQRCRRQFMTFTKSQIISDTGKIANMFVMFLNKSLH